MHIRLITTVSITIRLFLLTSTAALLLSGCVALHTTAELTYINGSGVESLSSNASLSYSASERSISGNGFLIYRKPNQIRVVLLSPFGSVIQEIYISDKFVSIIDSGNGIAFSGNQQDLPDKGDFSGWRYIHLLVDIDPPDMSKKTSVIERINRFGELEKDSFENGLLISKVTASGTQVRYNRYTVINGTALPLEITCETAAKEKFTIRLEDPEINIPLTDEGFAPNLSKLRVYPLSRLK